VLPRAGVDGNIPERKEAELLEERPSKSGLQATPGREVDSVAWRPGRGWRGAAEGLTLAALLALGACGPPPPEGQPQTSLAASGSREHSSPPGGLQRLVPPPAYAKGGRPAPATEAALQDLLRLRGRDGALLFRKRDRLQQVRVLEHSEGGLEPDRRYGFQGVVTLDGQKRYAKFLFGDEQEGGPQVQEILVLTHHTQTPYTWSEEESLWVAGQEEPLPP